MCVFVFVYITFLCIFLLNGVDRPSKVKIGATVSAGGSSSDSRRIVNNPSYKLSVTSRRIYVGQGLGLRQDTEPAFNPQGSAKQKLKEILRLHEEEYA